MIDVDVCVSSDLKEELTSAIDKWLWVIITIIVTGPAKTNQVGTNIVFQ